MIPSIMYNAGDTIQFAFTVDNTSLALRFSAASAPLPSGASAFANIVQVARTIGPLDGNIQLPQIDFKTMDIPTQMYIQQNTASKDQKFDEQNDLLQPVPYEKLR